MMSVWVMVLMLLGAAPVWAADPAKIDLNTATVEQLKQLERIGDAVAQRIVDYRQQNGPFAAVEDLMKVQCVGQKVFEMNKDRITVSAPVKK
jgi:competence protein ComEA